MGKIKHLSLRVDEKPFAVLYAGTADSRSMMVMLRRVGAPVGARRGEIGSSDG